MGMQRDVTVTCICGKHDLNAVDVVPTSARTADSEMRYQCAKILGELLSLDQEKAIYTFDHWRIIENRFPYDMIFKTHHMLLPIRIVGTRSELNEAEIRELSLIRDLTIMHDYDLVFENTPKRRSILSHYHLHLASYYDKRSDFKI